MHFANGSWMSRLENMTQFDIYTRQIVIIRVDIIYNLLVVIYYTYLRNYIKQKICFDTR